MGGYGAQPGLRDMPPGEEEDMPPPDEMGGEEDVEMDMDMADDPAEGGEMVSMDDFMSALERAIEEVTGEEADVSEEPGDEEMGMDDMGDEEGMEMDDEEPMMEEREAEARRKKREKMKQSEEEEEKAKDKGKKGFAEGAGHPKGHGASTRAGKTDRSDIANVVPSSGQLKEEEEELEERAPRMQRKASDFPSAEPGRKFGAPKKEKPIVGPEGEGAGEDEEPLRYKGSKGKRSGSGVGIPGVTSEEIVNEVAKRVAEKLQAQNSREQMVDQLAERIMKRLMKK